ncbi:PAS domain-containing protein [Sorangium atrum]|uniref:PAS domain-containing protein n=1 Tax=Sorangium atrum TaxID=2995308 RepID=A0ABT5BXN4_9BACT|nr:PAS domain-containing protein [Sorangium aterium]MDC0677706.1 PAS domain-containing protein [Sorangium aterium]
MREELDEAGRLRAENAELRARVEALEKALAERSNGHAQNGAAPAGAEALDALEGLPTAVPAVIHWRLDGEVTYWNDSAERLFGWSASEAVGRPLADLVGAVPVSAAAARAFNFAREESRFAATMSECRTKGGHALSCRWTYAVLRDGRGDAYELAALVDDTSDRERREKTVQGRYQLLLQLVDNARSSIFVKDTAGRYVLANRLHAQMMNRHVLELIGRDEFELAAVDPAASEMIVAKEREVMTGGQVMQFEEVVPIGGAQHHFFTVKFPIHDERGAPIGMGGIVTEITSLKRAEAERAALQEEIIFAQQAALRELSTPLIPLADRVVAMPLVGTIDSGRAEQIMETLLSGISSQGAHTAILDITGVRAVDTHVADALTRTARAAQLLGTRVVLTGVRPEVAQTLVTLGVDLSGITTLSTLQSGIAHALRHARR